MTMIPRNHHLNLLAVHAMNLLIQPLRQLAHRKCQVLAAKPELAAVGGTAVVATQGISFLFLKLTPAILHVELAAEALLDDHAADAAVKVAEDVGEVRTPGVAWDHGRLALSIGLGEDGGALALESGAHDCLHVY